MTRQKKNRSANNNGQRHLPAEEIRKQRKQPDSAKKKGVGLKSGSRNNLVTEKREQKSAAHQDQRIGSKKPISLQGPAVTEKTLPGKKISTNAILTPEEELQQIEQDLHLQQLLERVEQNETLSAKEIQYFEQKTARMEELLQQLLPEEQPEEEDDPLLRLERTDWRKNILGEED